MQSYNPIRQNLYMQSSLDNNPSNPNNTNLETIINKNPNNPHKNESGGVKKKILIAGGIAVSVLVVAGVAYALNPFNNNETLPTPTPYTPLTITTPAPTQTPKPTEPSLEDKLPAYAPLSATQIKEYMTTSLQIAYEATQEPNFSPERPGKKYDLAEKWLDRALYALKVSNFEYEKYSALYMTVAEWKYVYLSAEYKAKLMKGWKEDAAEDAKNPDEKTTIALIKSGLKTVLGTPRGSGGSR